ncbi:uncharacterized protein [Primulina huaijiensis]|uniref:uncharacterized protein n=1 Tax=Primulina huaijiensis TaxID=1492673 RepID=UPI003CC796D1
MPIRSQILMMTPLPTVGQAFSILSQEETHLTLVPIDTQPASVFYTSQHKYEETKKNQSQNPTHNYCEYCNWTGHTKATCYKLVGYPPGHRLYGQPPRTDNKRNFRGSGKPKQPAVAVNLAADCNSKEEETAVAKPSVPIFTSAQYAEIMKLLEATTVHTSKDPVANMAGPNEWEDNWNW